MLAEGLGDTVVMQAFSIGLDICDQMGMLKMRKAERYSNCSKKAGKSVTKVTLSHIKTGCVR